MQSSSSLTVRLLDRVERVGNRLPEPVTIFVILSFAVVFISAISAWFGLAVEHPGTGQSIAADSLLSRANLRRMMTDAVDNFALFPPLGLVLVTMIGIGVAERSELITAGLKQMVLMVPNRALTAALVFGGIMSSMAADAGYVVLTPLGAVLFAGLGRHPLAGLAAAFAGVSAGFSANLLLTSLDPLLSGLSTSAAQIIDPNYYVDPTANYYFMVASVFMLTIVGTFVTEKIVEPRLGPWDPAKAPVDTMPEDTGLTSITKDEKRGLVWAGFSFVALLVLLALVTLPPNAILRADDGSFQPFFRSLVMQIMLLFLIVGIVFGVVTKRIKSDRDVAEMMGNALGTMGAYIVLAFVAAQFVAYFNWSNLGVILAVSGAELLQSIGASGIPLILSFMIVSIFINLFIGSASAKWAIMAPVFVPMLMLMGYSPETVQAAYRVGDSVSNIITPLLPYFPVIIVFARRYDKNAGIGTLISAMIPYSVAFGIVWSIMLMVWMLLGIPLGPGAPVLYSPGG